ncbi:MAG: NAD(P)/FAD-dependent oxidoreductase [bacterium]
MKIGIVGGGIAGLTAAYRLAKAGHKPEVFEASEQLGGLARAFDFAGTKLDIFYRHIFTSDLDVIDLINELGLSEDLMWLESKMGFYYNGVTYPFSKPMDILFKFKALSFIDRVRLGLMTVYLTKVNNWKKYEKITAKEWVIKFAGQKVYDVVWGPLLEQKFADKAGEIAMTWLYGRIHSRIVSRKGAGMKEYLGYLKGSYQKMIDALETKILSLGGVIHKSSPVSKVIINNGKAEGVKVLGKDILFDAVIATPAPALLRKIVDFKDPEYIARFDRLNYFAAMDMVLRMKKSISPVYWLNVAEKNSPFVAIVEHTNFVPKEWYGGDVIVYVGNYISPEAELYKADNETVKRRFFDYIKKIYPSFDEKDVIEWKMFREPFSQPVVTKEFSKIKLDYKSPFANLYLANMSMVYPEDRGMSYSVMLGNKVAGVILGSK